MDEDYYKTLGVSREASQADIQKAWREIARKYHPDRNPGDKEAAAKFKAAQRAFEVLNDPKKRELYDRYGSAFESMGAAGAGPGGPRGAGPGGAAGFEEVDLSEFFGDRYGGAEGLGGFAEFFRHFGGGGAPGAGPGARTQRGPMRRRGSDLGYEIRVPFRTAVEGGETLLRVQRDGGEVEEITVKIPAGIEDGKKIRLRGQGEPGMGGAPAGDMLITVHVESHPHFHRKGKNLHVRVPVTVYEAAAGAEVDVPTPQGTVSLRVPGGTSSGTKLRIKGHGVRPAKGSPGDLLAEVQIVLPKDIDAATLETLRELDRKQAGDPRRDLRW